MLIANPTTAAPSTHRLFSNNDDGFFGLREKCRFMTAPVGLAIGTIPLALRGTNQT
jgi:hypothetical protein